MATNCYLVFDEEPGRGAIIDPGAEAARILSTIQQFSHLTISDILLTHGHPDHIGAVGELQRALGAKVVIHRDDAEMLGSVVLKELIDEDDHHLTVDGLRFTIYPTPGHTPGGVCFLVEEEGILFSGDTLFAQGVGRTDCKGGDEPALHQSLSKLFTLPPETLVYPGHGPAASLKDTWAYKGVCI